MKDLLGLTDFIQGNYASAATVLTIGALPLCKDQNSNRHLEIRAELREQTIFILRKTSALTSAMLVNFTNILPVYQPLNPPGPFVGGPLFLSCDECKPMIQ
jgi:hypothetical protein